MNPMTGEMVVLEKDAKLAEEQGLIPLSRAQRKVSLEKVDLAFARLEKAEDAMARFRRLERAFDKEDKEKGAI
jgi:hypothetical protein